MKPLSQVLNRASFFICLSIIITIFEFNAASFCNKYVCVYDVKTTQTLLFFTCYSLLLFLVTPAIASKFILRINLSEVGLALPRNKLLTAFLTLLAFSVLLPFIVHFSKLPSFQTYYALGHPTILKFALTYLTIVPLYYFAEEFFFRGFLFLNLWKKTGWHSFWISDLIFTLAHLGKPIPEILLSIPASVFLNFLTLESRSIYPAMLLHYIMGLLLVILINFR